MKIVQSFWSKPAELYGGYLRYRAHWPHPRTAWHSWVISTCWAHKHYGQVELVTDHAGARWLVDTLKLPFTSVRTDLEALNLSGQFWAAGKIVAYSIQDQPFFHIDGDVYLAGKLPARFESADLMCQVFEEAKTFPAFKIVYDDTREAMEQCLKKLPSCWRFTSERSAANCGICGGANLAAVASYCADVMSLLTDPANAPGWAQLKITGRVNCVVEQQMLWCSARQQGLQITPIFEASDFRDMQAFRKKAIECNYNHAASEGKNPRFSQVLSDRVEAEYPEQFKILNDLFPRTYADLAMPTVVQDEQDGDDPGTGMISRVELL